MYRFGWLIVAMLVTGCGPEWFDPYARPGTYAPAGNNDENLRVMVANPHDLVAGTGETTAIGSQAAPPVSRVFAGKRYPLPLLNAADINVFTEQPPQQGTANPASTQ
jgi:hypothetical protein